jgi:glutamate 5-kinase
MSAAAPSIDQFRRVVVKVGSSLLVDHEAGALRVDWLEALADDLRAIHDRGADVLVVSSGAVALGRSVLKLGRGTLKLEDSQAAAAVGQIALARTWAEALAARGIVAGQILVTLNDTEERRRYLNARETIGRLLDWRAAPIINENDTVATTEIRYGDNDRLAARVAAMVSADLLILLSDVDGLYTGPPHSDPSAEWVPIVARVTAAVEAMAGGAASVFSRGGMRTKIEAAKIATSGGAHMIIADGRVLHPLGAIAAGARCTWFLSPSTPKAARKTWIAGSLEPRGSVRLDAGAVRALASGASLLPAGVTTVEGEFARGDCVIIRDPEGAEIGRGLVAYDAQDALRIIGRNSREIETVLGVAGRPELIHRDDMALGFD